MEKTKYLSDQALRTQEAPISYLMTMALERKGLISLAAGFVDYETLPAKEMLKTCREILSDPAAAQAALQYGTTQGYPALRELILKRLEAREGVSAAEMNLTPDDVILTSGSQQLLFLISSVLINPGDMVLLPRPAYFVYTGTLQIFGTQAVGIDVDDEGMRADLLDRRLAELEAAGQLGRVKLVYVCSYFDNPTGLTLSAQRRRDIMEVVERWRHKQRLFLLEDAAYRDLVYDKCSDLPAMKTLDRRNETVILAQTFSKPLAPGMKTGYGFLPKAVMAPVLDQKGSHDFGSANLSQHIIHRLLESGRADKHLKRLCKAYRAKRDALLDGLEAEFSAERQAGQVTWTQPGGGLYVWLSLPAGLDTGINGSLFKRCLDAGVIYVPGNFCYCEEPGFEIPRNHMRLSFGVPDVAENREGARRLAQAIRQEMAR